MGGNTRLLWTLIIIAAAVAATACAGCTSNTTQSEDPSAPASFLQYTNKNAGVEMNYPSDWQLTGNPAVGTIARFEHGNDTILFEIQRTALNQTGQTVQSLASNYISAIQKSNGSALENHSASLGGLPGYKTVTAFKTGGQPYKALTIWTIKGNSLYEVKFIGVAAQYDEQNATAQQMISSFRFT
jgi:hypothetical protein